MWSKNGRSKGGPLDVTPLVDLVFLLIIFFMVGTKFADMERNVELQVPRVSQLGAMATA